MDEAAGIRPGERYHCGQGSRVTMIQALRSWFRQTESSVAATVGVVGGFAFCFTFTGIGFGFVLPILSGRGSRTDFEFTVGGVTFDYQQLFVNGFALLLLAALGYVLFVWVVEERTEVIPARESAPSARTRFGRMLPDARFARLWCP